MAKNGVKEMDVREKTPVASAAMAREYMNVLLDRLKKRAKTVLYDPASCSNGELRAKSVQLVQALNDVSESIPTPFVFCFWCWSCRTELC